MTEVFQTGHVKRDPATGRVALRTEFPANEMPDMVWLVATAHFGSKYVSGVEVDGWDDIYVAPLPSADNVQPNSVEPVDASATVLPLLDGLVLVQDEAPAESGGDTPVTGAGDEL